jgi:chromosome segregation ATPase
MSTQGLGLKRGLFGVSRSSVEEVLAESERRRVHAEHDLSVLKSKLDERTDEAERAWDDLADALEQLALERERSADLAAQLQAVSVIPLPSEDGAGLSIAVEDVASALEVAERTMDRIVADTRQRLTDEIASLERRRAELRDHVHTLEAFTEAVTGVAGRIAEAMRETRATMAGMEARMETAVQPLRGSLDGLSDALAALDDAASAAVSDADVTSSPDRPSR